MDARAYSLPVLVLFLFASLFGAYVMFGPLHMSSDCPLMRGEVALCGSSLLEHLEHWQLAFASILLEILALGGIAILFVYVSDQSRVSQIAYARVRLRKDSANRPTLFQELFSDGILHRRAP